MLKYTITFRLSDKLVSKSPSSTKLPTLSGMRPKMPENGALMSDKRLRFTANR